jgi:hypothetical protein
MTRGGPLGTTRGGGGRSAGFIGAFANKPPFQQRLHVITFLPACLRQKPSFTGTNVLHAEHDPA